MAVPRKVQRLLVERDYCFTRLLTAQMEGKDNAEGYWAMQFKRAQTALNDATDRAGMPRQKLQQLPLFLCGSDGVTFVRDK